MSKPARKIAAATPKRASKPRQTTPAESVNLGQTPFHFRYDPDAKKPIHGCPFVHKTSDAGPQAPGGTFWCVPATGGYDPGWRIGHIMGAFYLRAISDKRGGLRSGGSWLGFILEDLFARIAEATGEQARYSLRGQLLGFVEIIERAAAAGANNHPASFTTFDADEALRLAEAGLVMDEERWTRLQLRLHRVQEELRTFPGADLMSGPRESLLYGRKRDA